MTMITLEKLQQELQARSKPEIPYRIASPRYEEIMEPGHVVVGSDSHYGLVITVALADEPAMIEVVEASGWTPIPATH